MSAWQEVRDLVTARETKKLADRVITLTEAECAEVAGRLPGFLKEMRDTATEIARESQEADDRDALNGFDDAWLAWERRRTVRNGLAEFGAPLRIAGAGTISGPAAAAAWLTRRELYPEWGPAPDPAEVVRVLVTRPAEWQADVAGRLAGKIRRANDDRVAPLVLALLRASGVTPPSHDPLVVAWLTGPALDGDPLLGALLPRIFEAEGAGRALREERLTPSPTAWLSLIRRLLGAGRVSRAELLDGCVSRFLRGGDAADLRFFVRLHELIDPVPQEAAERARDYLRLLPAAPGPVAELALTQISRTGPHDDADVREAIEALTFRPEAKLARAGLSRLDQEVRQRPARAGELAPALATAFAHASDDVRRRAVRIALRHATALGADAKLIAGAVPLLPADLGRELAAVFGGEVTAEGTPEPFAPAPLPVLPEPGPFPAPTVDQTTGDLHGWVACEQWLAGFVERVGRDRAALRGRLTPVFQNFFPYLYDTERWLDPGAWVAALAKEVIAPGTDPGVPDPEPVDPWAGSSFSVRVTAVPPEDADDPESGPEDEPGLVDEAGPEDEDGVEEGAAPGPAFGDLPEHVREEIFRQMLEIGVSADRVTAMRDGLPALPPHPGEPGFQVGIMYSGFRPLFGEPEEPDPAVEFRRRNRLPEPRQVSPPHMFLLHRLSEIYRALREGTLPPVLLATPTVMTGHLDPGVLVDRLELCAAAGAEPLPADLQQALLRLPRGAHPLAAERAGRVRSQAAPAVAAWLARGGLPDPEAGVKWGYLDGGHEHLFEERDPGHVGQVRLVPVLLAEPTGHHLIDELLSAPPKWRWEDHGHVMGWWPSILPSHREVVSVHYLPHLLYQWNQPGVYPAYLEAVADADGPLGEATALILAYFLAERRPDPVPVLLRMASRGDLPAGAIGRQLALLIRRTWFETRPVLASLREAAHQGAHEQVWEIVRTLLPDLLPSAGGRPNVTHTEAVTLAADVAAWVGARGEIPAVSAHAATGRASRGSRFARECARLCDLLAG
ncbi:hypothetical protein F5972_26570 [Microbispora cellulosiformans]|uniref:Uncharacterized protein n=1 Tax=Microbispora cellulosiformans TaxID=2614688 RepID=A0A5J5JZR2_9ACTN|nr:DUF6493 family protein [Microbispora cellulosiformans]KAA9375760.1 hypothetical protein F5972_26570 [Microbispora cellulosiformans]